MKAKRLLSLALLPPLVLSTVLVLVVGCGDGDHAQETSTLQNTPDRTPRISGTPTGALTQEITTIPTTAVTPTTTVAAENPTASPPPWFEFVSSQGLGGHWRNPEETREEIVDQDGRIENQLTIHFAAGVTAQRITEFLARYGIDPGSDVAEIFLSAEFEPTVFVVWVKDVTVGDWILRAIDDPNVPREIGCDAASLDVKCADTTSRSGGFY